MIYIFTTALIPKLMVSMVLIVALLLAIHSLYLNIFARKIDRPNIAGMVYDAKTGKLVPDNTLTRPD